MSDHANQKPRIIKAEHRSAPSQTNVMVTGVAPLNVLSCECGRHGLVLFNGQLQARPHHDGARHVAQGDAVMVAAKMIEAFSDAEFSRIRRFMEREFARRDKVIGKRVA